MQVVSHDVTWLLSHIRVIFLNAATHPVATYPIAATNGVSVALDSMGAPLEPPNSLNNRDAANVQLPEVTTTYLSAGPESWVPPAPPWFLGLVKNVRRNLPICTSSPLTSNAESTGSRLT